VAYLLEYLPRWKERKMFHSSQKKKERKMMTTTDRRKCCSLEMFDLILLFFSFTSFSWKTPSQLGTRMRPKSVNTTQLFFFLLLEMCAHMSFHSLALVPFNFRFFFVYYVDILKVCLSGSIGSLFSKQFWNQFDDYFRFFTQAKE
jgi:hypothetical protein